MKILIIGDARHGKDDLAKVIHRELGLEYRDSSKMALNIFLFELLHTKYGLRYHSRAEAYEDRVNHREKWYNEITEYNREDGARLARDIMKVADVYCGMRNAHEIEACKRENLFDLILADKQSQAQAL